MSMRSPRLAPSAWVYLLGAGLLATAWGASDVHAQAAGASVRRYPPDPSRTRSVLDNSAAIFEAQVDDVRYTYDVHTGPRMVVDLAVTNLIAGALASDHVTIPMFGGPIPDGRFMSMSLSVKFAPGRHYILCLYNQPWFYTPLTAEALRVLNVNGREILASQSGFAVIGLNPQGLQYSKVPLYEGEDPSNLPDSDQNAMEHAPPEATAGALNRQDLIRLLKEGITIEGVAPHGSYTGKPFEREDWSIEPTEPAPPPSAATAPSDADVLIPTTPAADALKQ